MPIATTADLERLLNGGEAEPQWCRQVWPAFNERLGSFDKPPGFRVVAWNERGEIETEDPSIIGIRWGDEQVEVLLHSSLFTGGEIEKQHLLVRAFTVAIAISFIAHYRESREATVVCVSDRGATGILSFTGTGDLSKLIPDPEFFRTLGYERFKRSLNARWIGWSSRTPKVFWRGRLNGVALRPEDGSRWLPRAHLCALAGRSPHHARIDAKITGVDDNMRRFHADRLEGVERLIGEFVEPEAHIGYRYLIDIDGWANAWSGLFQKLLTGSTVLKVDSQRGFRQWYYDRLEPWVNYVPVRADLGDLDEAISFVLENDDRAREIGEAGRRLALSLNLESEIYGMAARL